MKRRRMRMMMVMWGRESVLGVGVGVVVVLLLGAMACTGVEGSGGAENLQFEWRMRHEDCAVGSLPNSGWLENGAVTVGTPVVNCPVFNGSTPVNGLFLDGTGPGAWTDRWMQPNMTGIFDLTFEIWFMPTDYTEEGRIVTGVSNPTMQSHVIGPGADCMVKDGTTDQMQFHYAIVQNGTEVYAMVCPFSGPIPVGRALINVSEPVHVMLAFVGSNNDFAELYVNGQPATSNVRQPTCTTTEKFRHCHNSNNLNSLGWQMRQYWGGIADLSNDGRKFFLGSYGRGNETMTPFEGYIYYSAYHNKTFNALEAAARYNESVPFNYPFAKSYNLTINEDGEQVAGGFAPNAVPYYSSPLPYSSLERQARLVVEPDKDPRLPNGRGAYLRVPFDVTVTQSSSSKVKYFDDGTQTFISATTHSLSDTDPAMRFTTDMDYYTKTPSPHPDPLAGQLDLTVDSNNGEHMEYGSLQFTVTAVNDPPRINPIASREAFADVRLKFDLNNTLTDPDSNSFPNARYDVAFPNGGIVYAPSGSPTPVPVSNTFGSAGDITFDYEYEANEALAEGDQFIACDTGNFSVTDGSFYSAEATINVCVRPSIVPVPSSGNDQSNSAASEFPGYEYSSVNFTIADASDKFVDEKSISDTDLLLYAVDLAERDGEGSRPLRLVARNLPRGTGTLRNSGTPVVGNTTLMSTSPTSTTGYVVSDAITYTATAADGFTEPRFGYLNASLPAAAPLWFDYYVEDLSSAHSYFYRQRIHIRNVNEDFTTPAITTDLKGNANNPLNLPDVQINDPDNDTSALRVSVSVGEGAVSFPTSAGLDFVSTDFCRVGASDGRWECAGSASGGANITFVGTPSAISAALDGASGWEFLINQAANTTLRLAIFDGAYDGTPGDEGCIDLSAHQTYDNYTRFDNCWSHYWQVRLSVAGTVAPTTFPSLFPSAAPTTYPSANPTIYPTHNPTTVAPSLSPTLEANRTDNDDKGDDDDDGDDDDSILLPFASGTDEILYLTGFGAGFVIIVAVGVFLYLRARSESYGATGAGSRNKSGGKTAEMISGPDPASSGPIGGSLRVAAPSAQHAGSSMVVASQNRPETLGGGSPDAAPAPPSVWVELQDDQGRTYYYNRSTKSSTWVRPQEMPY